MKKFLKISLIVLSLLLLSIVLLPFAFKGKIIQAIRDEANKNLHAKVDFSDEIGISIFRNWPRITLEMHDVSIAGVDTFSRDTLAFLPEISVSMNIMSVIRGEKMEISRIALQKPEIHLYVLENGRANWDIAIPDSAAADTTPSGFKMALELLEITGGNLVYEDLSIPFYTELRGFDHTLKGDFTLDRFMMETKTVAEAFTLGYGGMNYISEARTEILANLDMDMKEMKFTFSDNHIRLNELQLGGEGFVDMNDENMDFDLAFRSKSADFKTIMSLVPGVYSKDFAQAKASGKLAFSGYMKGRMTDEKMPGFGLKLDIDQGYFQYPDLPKSLSNIFVDLSVDNKSGDPDHTVINLKRLDADIAGEHIFARLLMKTPLSDPYTEGELKGKIRLSEFRSFIPLDKATEISGLISSDIRFNGRVSAMQKQDFNGFHAEGLLSALDFHFKDPEMLPQGCDLNTSLKLSPQYMVVESCTGRVGMSDFDIKGRIDNAFAYLMHDQLLQGRFSLNSAYFNANEFLSNAEVKEEPAPTDSIPLQAFEVPGNLDFEFVSDIKTLIYDNLKMTDLKGKVIIRDRELLFEKVGVNLLDGSMALNGVYDSRNPKFPFSNIDFQIKSLDIIKTFTSFDMVQKLMPIAAHTHGHFNAGIKLANNFNQDLSVSYPTVTGEIRMGITEAMVKDFQILNILADKLKIDRLKTLSLKKLSFKMNILQGKVYLDSFILPMWTGARARISGYSALDQSMNYVAKLSIPRKDFGEANAALDKLSAQARAKGLDLNLSEMVDVDVLISGFFSKPDVKISLHDARNSLVGGIKSQLIDEAEKRKQAAIEEARRRAEAARKKTMDSLNRVKQMAIDKAAAEKKALEEKLAEEKRKAEEKLKAEEEKARQEAARKLEEEKKKALEKLRGGIRR